MTVTARARDSAIAIAQVAELPVVRAMELVEEVDRPPSPLPLPCAARIGPESLAAALADASPTTKCYRRSVVRCELRLALRVVYPFRMAPELRVPLRGMYASLPRLARICTSSS